MVKTKNKFSISFGSELKLIYNKLNTLQKGKNCINELFSFKAIALAVNWNLFTISLKPFGREKLFNKLLLVNTKFYTRWLPWDNFAVLLLARFEVKS